jgi:hypothetical protein
MPPTLGKLAREPVVHFLLVGALIFAAERVMSSPLAPTPGAAEPGRERPVDRRIVVDEAARKTVTEDWVTAHDRPPTDEELRAGIEKWVDDEVLFREGMQRGLDVGDARVRERVRSKMAGILAGQVAAPEPTRQDLEAWFLAHQADYAKPELVDFVHVFVAGDGPESRARAAALLEQLRGGANPNGLGDTFSGGRRYRRRKLPDLQESFGEDFAAALANQRQGDWELLHSRFGMHVVRVEQRTAAGAPALDEVEAAVRQDWQEKRRAERIVEAMGALRRRYQVVTEP